MLSTIQKGLSRIKAEKICFTVFGCFGLLAYLWGHCPVYPQSPYWLMCCCILPLILFTTAWVVVTLPITYALAALADVATYQ